MHKSGFVNIIGRPNVGKSTIMNALVGERMSIITAKPQTTRHRIIGILSSDDFQIVFSDTPGIIQKPAYKMQESLNRFAYSAFDDADVLLFVATADEKYTEEDPLIRQLNKLNQPKFLIYNKIDLSEQEQVKQAMAWWNAQVNFTESFAVSALHQANLSGMLERILAHLPEAPAYYPKDQLTDRPERFFVAEIIREKMLEQYYQEIPYSVEVTVEAFQETKTKDGIPLINIQALIFAARLSQKAIILGKNGSAIKQLGTSARKALETWLEKKVFLELHVKVRENWRDDDKMLKAFGYE